MKKVQNNNIAIHLSTFVIGILLLSQNAVAEDTAGSSPINAAYLVQVLLGLGLVILLILAIAWLVKKFGQGMSSSNQHMKILSHMQVGTREKVLIVGIGQKQIMLGVTAQQINTLQVFDEPVIDTRSKREVSEFSQKILEIMRKGSVK